MFSDLVAYAIVTGIVLYSLYNSYDSQAHTNIVDDHIKDNRPKLSVLIESKKEELFQLTGINIDVKFTMVWYDYAGSAFLEEGQPAYQVVIETNSVYNRDLSIKYIRDVATALDHPSVTIYSPISNVKTIKSKPEWLSTILQAQEPDDFYTIVNKLRPTLLWSCSVTPLFQIDFHDKRRRCLLYATTVNNYSLLLFYSKVGETYLFNGGFDAFSDIGKEESFKRAVNDFHRTLCTVVGDTTSPSPVFEDAEIFYCSK